MNIILTVFLVAFTTCLAAQDVSTDLKRNVLNNYSSTNGVIYTRMLNNLDNMKGEDEFLLNKIWQKTKVTDNLGNLIVIDSANYNMERDLFLFYKNGDLFYLYPDQIREVKIANKTFKTHYSDVDNKTVFYEQLSEGKLSLLRRYSVIKVKKSTHPMGIQHNNEKLDKKIKDKFYYYNVESEKLKPIPKKKKKFLLIFNKNRNRLLDFIRSNSLSNKKEEDLVLIFDHYNIDLVE